MTDQAEITINVHGAVGIGKTAVVLAILDRLRAVGLNCEWADEAEERNAGSTARDIENLEHRPLVRLIETNPSMVKPPAPLSSAQVGEVQGDGLETIIAALEHSKPTHDRYPEPVERHAEALAHARALAARQPVAWQMRTDERHNGFDDDKWMEIPRDEYEAYKRVMGGDGPKMLAGATGRGDLRIDDGGWMIELRQLFDAPPAQGIDLGPVSQAASDPSTQIHIGTTATTGGQLWHSDGKGGLWCGNTYHRTPRQLWDECQSVLSDLRILADQRDAAPAEFKMPAVEAGKPIPVVTEHGAHADGGASCPICIGQNEERLRLYAMPAQDIDLLATVRRLRQHLAKASFATEVDRHSAGDLVSDLVDAIDERREGVTGFTIRQPVPEPTTEGFAPFYFERPIGGGSVSLVNRSARDWPEWAEEAAKACNYSSPLVGMEMRRLRLQVETLTRDLLEAKRLAWLLARSAPGGEVTINLHLLQSTDWSLAELQKNRDKSGFTDTWVAKLQGQPQPAGLHQAMALIDTSLGYLSTALDDLNSSPDPRPGIMVQEAMGCLRQVLVGSSP